MQEKRRAVLWDMDGTLLDSTEYHWEAWVNSLARESFELTREAFLASFGQRNREIIRGHLGADCPDEKIERIARIKEEFYREMVRTKGVSLFPGIERWILRLKESGWQQAIASSAPLENIETVLSVLRLEKFFDSIVSGGDVTRSKPDPQVFLIAAQRVHVPPANCIVVEDAPAGIESGKRAGMKTIGVLTNQASLDADIVVSSLDELPSDAFEKILDGELKFERVT
jgi:beta-phosphoglucomutase family hydrolase